jgi:hypothetical protein
VEGRRRQDVELLGVHPLEVAVSVVDLSVQVLLVQQDYLPQILGLGRVDWNVEDHRQEQDLPEDLGALEIVQMQEPVLDLEADLEEDLVWALTGDAAWSPEAASFGRLVVLPSCLQGYREIPVHLRLAFLSSSSRRFCWIT